MRLNERSQINKATQCDSHLCEMSRTDPSTETGSGLVFVRGWGRRWGVTTKGDRASLGGDGMFWN